MVVEVAGEYRSRTRPEWECRCYARVGLEKLQTVQVTSSNIWHYALVKGVMSKPLQAASALLMFLSSTAC